MNAQLALVLAPLAALTFIVAIGYESNRVSFVDEMATLLKHGWRLGVSALESFPWLDALKSLSPQIAYVSRTFHPPPKSPKRNRFGRLAPPLDSDYG